MHFDPRTKLFLEATVWLDRVIDIMHPVDNCFVISPRMKKKIFICVDERTL